MKLCFWILVATINQGALAITIRRKKLFRGLGNHPTIFSKHPIVLASFKINFYLKNNIKIKDGFGWLENSKGIWKICSHGTQRKMMPKSSNLL
jgi:hypothetical protein